MNMVSEKDLEMFAKGCHRVAECDLVRYSSGNMSARVGDDLMLMTAKGAWLGEVKPEEVVVCRISDAEPVDGKTASVERVFHAGILRERPEVRVVLHHQSPAATAISCSGDPLGYDFMIIPEVPFYIGKIGCVEFFNPGSKDLADAVIEVMKKHEATFLKNHGQVVVGKDYEDAIQKAGFLELACEILLKNPNARPMPDWGRKALEERAGRV